jgi:thioredoxin-like negative regulator of GroEL
MQLIQTNEALSEALITHPTLLIYVSGEDCAVCKSLKPKLEATLSATLPRFTCLEVKREASPDLAATLGVFSIPTALVFFEGKEHQRYGRSMSPSRVAEELRRPYELLLS